MTSAGMPPGLARVNLSLILPCQAPQLRSQRVLRNPDPRGRGLPSRRATGSYAHQRHSVSKLAYSSHASTNRRYRLEIPEMIACIEPLNSGFALRDPSDRRHQYITGLRRKFGEFLHKASISLQQQGEENTVDAVHGLVRYFMSS